MQLSPSALSSERLFNSASVQVSLVAIITMGLFSGCSKEAITVTTIPKERVNLAYVAPDHWKLQAGSAMRAVSFSIPDDHGHNGEVSVLPMPRLNIDDIEIVNLWRQQVGLEPTTADQVSELASKVNIGSLEGNLFDLESPTQGNDPDHSARIVTAYLHNENITWFFKLTGPSHFVEVEKPAFTQFLASVNLAKLQQDFQRRAAAQRGPAPSGGPSPSRELPEWTVPTAWQSSTPSSSMLLASFSINEQVDGPAEVTVTQLGGGAGGLLLNINRWRQQIGLRAISAEEMPDMIQSLNVENYEATLVDLKGSETRIVTAIVTVGNQTWFYKMMGASGTIDGQINAFTRFVQSVNYPDNG